MIVSLTLPDSVKSFVDARVNAGGFRDAGEYLLALIEAERAQEAEASRRREELRATIGVGLADLAAGRHADYDSAEQLSAEIKAEGRAWLEAQPRRDAK